MSIDLDLVMRQIEESFRGFRDGVLTDEQARALVLEVERLRENAQARERFLHREGDALRAAERERDELRNRLLRTAQILIAEVGSDGPMNADGAALAAVELIERLRVKCDALNFSRVTLRVKLEELRAKIAHAQAERDEACEQQAREVAYLRACVPPSHPSDYGYEAWGWRLRAEVAAERAAVVAWLRDYAVPRKIDPDVLALLPPGATVVSHFADEIERGEHRREGDK